MIDKSKRKATAERYGSVVVIRMTGGPDCLWLNMYLDLNERQMVCDSDIGFYAYHWGKEALMTEGFVHFCTFWLADDDWLLRKCIVERNVPKEVDKAETKSALMEAFADEDPAGDRDDYDDFLESIAAAERFDTLQCYSEVLVDETDRRNVKLPEDYWEYIVEDYTPWQKRFAEICREVIVPELMRLAETEGGQES